MTMTIVRGTPMYSSVTLFCRRFAQFRNLSSETKLGYHDLPTENLDAKDCNFIQEICRITRTEARWEDTLLSLYPSFNFSEPSFFLLYLNHQNNAFLSLRFFHWLCSSCGFSPDQSSCNALFCALVDAGACKTAKLLLDYPSFTPEPASLECYIQCLGRAGMVEDAVDMLKQVGFCPSVATWNACLLSCLKAGRTDFVRTLYEQMAESGVINVETAGYMIMAFCAENKALKGYELLRELLENGLLPDNVVFNALIRGFCKERQYARVSEILHIMIAKQCNPNIFTYQEIINGLLKRKNSEGFRVFNDLKDRGYFPDRVMYTTVIKGLCEMGMPGEARKMWFEMIKKGFQPNEYTYNIMMHQYFKIGDLVSARKIFEDMCSRGYAETTVCYTTMISGLCLHGRTDEAHSLFEEMVQKGIVRDLITYNSLIKGLCKNGELVQATKLLNELLAHGLKPSVSSLNPLIKRLCEEGDTQGAIRLWEDMQDKHLQPIASTHDYIITGLCKEGHSLQGMERLLNMSSWKLKPQEQTFEFLINSLSQEDRLDDILVVLEFMFRIGYRLKESTIHSLVSKFSRGGFHFPDLCLEKIIERN
ncbi:pentatricopeptide repeat-containing protein At5g18950 [Vigna radiata var. radiata]|uniref:Pentatricopeptide repeat-containing protein At5g18950 n=1 Tax=Vigna radiata var. radiata TaxID=3916 RepID=A0A1S3VQF5_VIGRR|nr:pentatricopeptide repeat-containing protein At5g18950 [Vigna radiata var. radiata]XP_022643292.1 pentatricopeptide repeat-containing protein At5g18950 [Vigna radiata var. radiata]XP_022643293.1 pentatricopeptide repeat-containing protein At5g18950 [Vigna radiata var. radiata]